MLLLTFLATLGKTLVLLPQQTNMAYGKNKGLAKGGKKGQKKKQADPFLKKVWYDIKAPTYFGAKRRVGRTMVTKTAGQKIETDGLKGRVAEFNLHDLND